MNFEVSSCTKFKIFRGSAPDPAGELTALPHTPSWWGGSSLPPPKELYPRSRPFGPRASSNPPWGKKFRPLKINLDWRHWLEQTIAYRTVITHRFQITMCLVFIWGDRMLFFQMRSQLPLLPGLYTVTTVHTQITHIVELSGRKATMSATSHSPRVTNVVSLAAESTCMYNAHILICAEFLFFYITLANMNQF